MSKIKYIQNLLETKEISCVELTKKYISNIEKQNKILNAYVNVTGDEALKTAKIVDEKIEAGKKLMTLEGIPMSLKDNISTKDIETTCCSKMLKGYYPIFDATVWQILKNQNAVLLGKTNMDEFAMGSSCETSYFGGVLNPRNTDYVAGGSSGGAAASVASKLAVFGLGSDTGGSIRQPASFCGLVGFKPTYGTVSRYGVVAYASSLDQVGPITDSVEDAALV
ncbi:MAG: Asp-tRNA(Asn)/Glu-tRNA(Gln) amidotransferase subunit GatA, partial [Tissierellia bacterium]|nr:Asp-tRNA(Asn)/Glu-tRNA(Gln) amidotransferase subunit GatA [Tissierellia bacterium]